MKISVAIAATAAMTTLASPAGATTVNNTDLANVNGSYGSGTAVTTTTANGTVTTVTGPGGGANRADAPTQANKWLQRSVGGNASVGITKDYARSGNGSAFFSGTDGASKADLEYYFAAPVALSSVVSLSYDWYRDSSSTTNPIQVPSLRLALTNGSQFTYLIFEPYYNGQANPAATDSWQSSTMTAGSTVWSNNSVLTLPVGTNNCGVGCFSTLAAWQAANPGFAVYGLSTGIGSGWSGSFRGGIDNVAYDFGTAGSGSFNFEVAAAVPEPASWALMISGFGLVGAAMRRRAVRTVLA